MRSPFFSFFVLGVLLLSAPVSRAEGPEAENLTGKPLCGEALLKEIQSAFYRAMAGMDQADEQIQREKVDHWLATHPELSRQIIQVPTKSPSMLAFLMESGGELDIAKLKEKLKKHMDGRETEVYWNKETRVAVIVSPFGMSHSDMGTAIRDGVPNGTLILGGTRYTERNGSPQWLNSGAFSHLPGLEVQKRLFDFQIRMP